MTLQRAERRVKNLSTVIEQLRRNQSTVVSSGVVTIPEQTLGFKKAILVRDPDGHALWLVEK